MKNKKLTNFEKHLQEEMKNPEFRKAYHEAGVRLEIAYKINRLRKKQKVSQQELAKRIGTTQSAVARIENGDQNFTADMLDKIASAFSYKLKIEFVR